MKAANSDKKDYWHPLWKLMWVLTTPIWIGIAFVYPITGTGELWIVPTPVIAPMAFIVLFLVPELVSIFPLGNDDRRPPLTHMIRGYVPDDLAFPAIYFLVGALGGRWFGFPVTRFVGLGLVAGILGWLSIHFTMAYLETDPRFRAGAAAVSSETRRHFEL